MPNNKIFFPIAVLIPILIPVFVSTTVFALDTRKEIRFEGKTMGTTYHITAVADKNVNVEETREKIDQVLEKINDEMSVYRETSEISRFNALKKNGVKFAVSENFMDVLRVSKSVHEITGGAWDATVNPLLELWGFRSKNPPETLPDENRIESAMSRVGFDKIVLVDDRHIMKTDPEVSLDLASIAKGAGVDRVAELLLKNGFENFIVEIGGEMYAAGLTVKGEPWRAGINTPVVGSPFDEVFKVIALSDAAMATSGDYRNFIEIGGRRYSHIIDPRTGRPSENNVAAATVIGPTCAFADGLATAAMVLGLEKSLELIDRLKGVEGFIVVRDADGALSTHYSKGLAPR